MLWGDYKSESKAKISFIESKDRSRVGEKISLRKKVFTDWSIN